MTLLIHGGAGTIAAERREAYLRGLQDALDNGHRLLEGGGAALDAVLKAVSVMEDNPEAFNAGTGAAPTREGKVECDAAVMLSDGSCGAVALVSVAKNPVLIAERVRRDTPHVLLGGDGADALVDNPIDNRELLTAHSRQALSAWRKRHSAPTGTATVGAVALDVRGQLAAATSTGGILGQWSGRIGDTPLIGAGTYADRNVAVSCTGLGEAFIRAVAGKEIAVRLDYGAPLSEAVTAALDNVKLQAGHGGLIAITRGGEIRVGFNSPAMAYAWRSQTGERCEIASGPALIGP